MKTQPTNFSNGSIVIDFHNMVSTETKTTALVASLHQNIDGQRYQLDPASFTALSEHVEPIVYLTEKDLSVEYNAATQTARSLIGTIPDSKQRIYSTVGTIKAAISFALPDGHLLAVDAFPKVQMDYIETFSLGDLG